MSHYNGCVKFEFNEKRIWSVSLYSISLSMIRNMFLVIGIVAIYFNFSITFSLNIIFYYNMVFNCYNNIYLCHNISIYYK